MNANRVKLIQMAFDKLDKSGDGQVTIDDLRSTYNVENHPNYQNGTSTKEELLRQFLAKFEQKGVVDGIVSQLDLFDK
jgi:Ca2+-binding EF-hand superfamily protein